VKGGERKKKKSLADVSTPQEKTGVRFIERRRVTAVLFHTEKMEGGKTGTEKKKKKILIKRVLSERGSWGVSYCSYDDFPWGGSDWGPGGGQVVKGGGGKKKRKKKKTKTVADRSGNDLNGGGGGRTRKKDKKTGDEVPVGR